MFQDGPEKSLEGPTEPLNEAREQPEEPIEVAEKENKEPPEEKVEKVKKEAKESRKEIMAGVVAGKWLEITNQTEVLSKKGLFYLNQGDRVKVLSSEKQTFEGHEDMYRVQIKSFNTLTGGWKVEEGFVKMPLSVQKIEVPKEKARKEAKEELAKDIRGWVDSAAAEYAKTLDKNGKKTDASYEILSKFMDTVSQETLGSARPMYPVSTPELLRQIKKRAKAIFAKRPKEEVKPEEEQAEEIKEVEKFSVRAPEKKDVEAIKNVANGFDPYVIKKYFIEYENKLTEEQRTNLKLAENLLSGKILEYFKTDPDTFVLRDKIIKTLKPESETAAATITSAEVEQAFVPVRKVVEQKFDGYFNAEENLIDSKVRKEAFRFAWHLYIPFTLKELGELRKENKE